MEVRHQRRPAYRTGPYRRGGDLGMVRQILRGHEYLRLKGLSIDLVILNDHPPSYLQSLHDEVQTLIRSTGMQTLQDKPGGIYLRRADIMPDEDKILLHTVARIVSRNRTGYARRTTRAAPG